MKCLKVDIEMHDKETCPNGSNFIQAKFLMHGFDDVMWTDDIESILAYVREELERCDSYKK